MKLKHAAIIATVLVILVGVAMIVPMFFYHNEEAKFESKLMLSFSVLPGENVIPWCQELATALNSLQVGGSVFFVGEVAEKYPQCLSYFKNQIDIGSQTYSNADLTQITDYSLKLEEVQKGKNAVDKAGRIQSRIFRAPFGATDGDIYSLLSQSGIQADFSYDQQYNLYRQDQFVKYKATVYNGYAVAPNVLSNLSESDWPVIVCFDNTQPVSEIEKFLSGLDMSELRFVNASELAGSMLTSRGVAYGDSRTASK